MQALTTPQRHKRAACNLGDKRGSSYDRRMRKLWMLRTWNPELGDDKCECVHCHDLVDYNTVEADRIQPRGPYTHANVQPSCRPCNIERGNDTEWSK